MKGEFVILVVCAAFVHISLVEISPATAVISKKIIDEFEFIRLRQRASFLGIQNIIESIFPQNLDDYPFKGGLSDGESNGGNQTEEEKCLYHLLAYGNGVIADTMSVATVLDPEIFPVIMSAHAPTVNGLTNLFTDVCTASKLAARNHSSAAAAQIQALNNKNAALAVGFNTPYFAAIRASKKFRPEMETLYSKYETQATENIVKAFINTFDTIQEFGSKGGLEGAIEEISSLFDTRRKQIISANCDSLQAKYDFAEAVYTSSQMIQCAGQNENQNITATAVVAVKKGLSTVFDTILRFENQRLSSKVSYETAINETSAAYISGFHAVYNAILKINPECSQVAEVEAVSTFKIKKDVEDFYKIFSPESSESELQTMEARFTEVLSELVRDLYNVFLQCSQPPPMNRRSGLLNLGLPRLPKVPSLLRLNLDLNQILGLIHTHKEKSLANARRPFAALFGAFRPSTGNPNSGILGRIIAPLTNVQTETSAGAKDTLDSVYDAIITVVKGSGRSDTDIAETLSAIEVCRQQTRLEIDKGFGIIFRFLTAKNQNVPEKTSSDIIEAPQIGTFNDYSTVVKNIFRALGPSDTKTAAEEATLAALRKAVDGTYRAIQGAQGNESCEILNNWAEINETGIQGYLLVCSEIYDEFKRSSHYNVEDEPALTRNQYETIDHTTATAAAVFEKIRLLAVANCPGSGANSKNNSSPITADHDYASSEVIELIRSYFTGIAIVSGESKDNIADPPTETNITRTVTRTIITYY